MNTPNDASVNCTPDCCNEYWKTEFDKRITAFAKVSGLAEAKVREVLAGLGATGTDERSLKLLDSNEFLPMSDLFEAFCDTNIISKGILRMGVAELRGRRAGDTAECVAEKSYIAQPDIADAIREVVSANRPKSDWDDGELLKRYDRDEVEIAKILSTRTRGRPCMVFNEDGSINVEVSLKLVKVARRQPTAETHAVGDKEVWVFPAGKFPAKPVNASPFYPSSALVDGYCARSSTDWGGFPQKNRILVYLHVHKIETTQLSQSEMRQIWNEAKSIKSFVNQYPKAALIYKDLEEKGELPKLTISPNSVIPNGVKDSGFCCE